MKFYRYKLYINQYIPLQEVYYSSIKDNKLNAIFQNYNVIFFKNGLKHNDKNKAVVSPGKIGVFCLNNKCYGYEDNFTKQSWRRFF
jgi:hypothetical protein